jgi:hypothetical protein
MVGVGVLEGSPGVPQAAAVRASPAQEERQQRPALMVARLEMPQAATL